MAKLIYMYFVYSLLYRNLRDKQFWAQGVCCPLVMQYEAVGVSRDWGAWTVCCLSFHSSGQNWSNTQGNGVSTQGNGVSSVLFPGGRSRSYLSLNISSVSPCHFPTPPLPSSSMNSHLPRTTSAVLPVRQWHKMDVWMEWMVFFLYFHKYLYLRLNYSIWVMKVQKSIKDDV